MGDDELTWNRKRELMAVLAVTVVGISMASGVFMGLSASDWAAWVQAIGSLIGLSVAVWVPFKISKHERRERHQREDHEIAVLATSVSSKVGVLKGLTAALLKRLPLEPAGLVQTIRREPNWFRGHPVPTEEDALRLGVVHPSLGATLAQGVASYNQFRAIFDNIRESDSEVFLNAPTEFPIASLRDANQRFERFLTLMGELFEKLELRKEDAGLWD